MDEEKKQKVFELLQNALSGHLSIDFTNILADQIANILDEEEPEETLEETLEEKFERVWNENIMLSMLRYCSHVFINSDGKETSIPTSRIRVMDSNRDWLFDYNYDPNKANFWVSYGRVWVVLKEKVVNNDEEIQRLMSVQVEKQFGLKGVTPLISALKHI
jgi:hypothetical protein